LPHPQSRAARYDRSVHKILVIEDDDDVREVVRETLEDEGYWVAVASNGQEALELLSHESEPCLILLDLMMPVATGWQFRAKQLQDPFLARFPVVVMTATDTLEEAAIHADGLLKKPVRLNTLLECVARFCSPDDFSSSPTTEQFAPRLPLQTDDSG
jgi:CheY-like chemotaxis protein